MVENPFSDRIKKVAVIAPAGPPDKLKVDSGVAALKQFGIEVILMPNIFKQSDIPYTSASVEDRVADLHSAWSDLTVDLILCARGGYGSVQLLEEIDWDLLRTRDIPFLGYSDITALHLAMIQQGVKKPISAPMCCDIAEALAHSLSRTSLHQSLTNSTGKIEASSVSGHVSLNSPVIAVNLTVCASMIGTPFFPDLSGTILLVEDVAEDTYRIDRNLTQLSLSGLLRNSAGVIFGDFKECGDKNELDELFKRFAEQNQVPTFKDASFGHIRSTHSIMQNQAHLIMT